MGILNCDYNGNYYIHTYTPYQFWSSKSEKQQEISQMILRYKEFVKPNHSSDSIDAFNRFTSEIKEGVIEILQKTDAQIINLVAAPPPKLDTKSTIMLTISSIYKDLNDSKLKKDIGINRIIQDKSTLLNRWKNVPIWHAQGKSSYDELYDSLECTEDDLSQGNTAFILFSSSLISV